MCSRFLFLELLTTNYARYGVNEVTMPCLTYVTSYYAIQISYFLIWGPITCHFC